MNHLTTIKSETIKTDDAIHTIILSVDHNKEYTRTIISTDADYHNKQISFATLEEAEARFNRDIRDLTPKNYTETYGHHKLSRAAYIKATVEERIITAATDEMHEHSVDMLNMTAGASDRSDTEIDYFISSVETEMVDELIKQLKAYRKTLAK